MYIKLRNLLLLVAWLCFATLMYGAVWARNVDLFPDYPEWLRALIISLTSSLSPEATDDIGLLAGSFIAVSVLTLTGYFVWLIYKKLSPR
ncbi:MAG: hypothetical protein LBT71_09850 [Azoarcus sp.]|jgi:hypothetical protein|nr:hypothetical protein [Azoarcus sp.]